MEQLTWQVWMSVAAIATWGPVACAANRGVWWVTFWISAATEDRIISHAAMRGHIDFQVWASTCGQFV